MKSNGKVCDVHSLTIHWKILEMVYWVCAFCFSFLQSKAHITLFNLSLSDQFGGELSQLDDAGTYFDLGPRRVSQMGTYQYMCTRNNDFSNRDQKGRITVVPYPIVSNSIGWTGGMVSLADR